MASITSAVICLASLEPLRACTSTTTSPDWITTCDESADAEVRAAVVALAPHTVTATVGNENWLPNSQVNPGRPVGSGSKVVQPWAANLACSSFACTVGLTFEDAVAVLVGEASGVGACAAVGDWVGTTAGPLVAAPGAGPAGVAALQPAASNVATAPSAQISRRHRSGTLLVKRPILYLPASASYRNVNASKAVMSLSLGRGAGDSVELAVGGRGWPGRSACG